jgi:hypothetical protein
MPLADRRSPHDPQADSMANEPIPIADEPMVVGPMGRRPDGPTTNDRMSR